jgi:hypothetical protein
VQVTKEGLIVIDPRGFLKDNIVNIEHVSILTKEIIKVSRRYFSIWIINY